MAAPVYTERILYWEGGPVQLDWEVPEGKRVIVRQIAARSEHVAGGTVYLGVHGIWAFQIVIPDSTVPGNEALSMVAYERETVSIATSGVSMSVVLTGWVFQDGVGRPEQAVEVTELPIGVALPAALRSR